MIRAAIFDLDGTLIDSLDDLADSMNEALAANGLPTHPREAFFYFVGNGVKDLVSRTLPEALRTAEPLLTKVTQDYREAYGRNWHAKTRPYDGIFELIAHLKARNFPMAVLSNKPQHFTELCVNHFFPSTFTPLLGQRDHVPRKPDPAGAAEIAAHWGLRPEEIAFVGDTSTDMHTAVNAGMVAVGVTWGFRDEAELRETGATVICHTPAELQNALLPISS